MLVLTRRAGESIVIEGGVVLTILETGSRVKVGVVAPDRRVLRGELVTDELHELQNKKNKEAA